MSHNIRPVNILVLKKSGWQQKGISWQAYFGVNFKIKVENVLKRKVVPCSVLKPAGSYKN